MQRTPLIARVSRTRRSRLVRHVVAAVLAATSARAQSPTTLGDVYRAAATGPRIAAARAAARAADARVSPVTRLPDPAIQLGVMNYALPSLSPMSTIGMTQLQVMQMLPVGGKLAAAGAAATARAAAEQSRADDVAWSVRADAADAYYEAYAADRQLDVARETLHLLREAAATAEAMYRVGEGRQADVLRAQVEVARMAEDTLRMHAMRESAVARLGALVGPMADSLGATALPAFPDSLPSLDSLVALAFAGRPMLRADARAVDGARADEKLARREIWPDLTVGVQVAQSAGGGDRMGSVMIGATLPIFARDRQLRMRDEASAMRQMTEADYAATRADTRARVIAVRADLERARRLRALYSTSVLPQARATVTSAMSAYRTGSIDFMTLLDDEMAVNRYRQELAQLQADEGKSWAELEMLVGRALFDPDATATLAEGGAR